MTNPLRRHFRKDGPNYPVSRLEKPSRVVDRDYAQNIDAIREESRAMEERLSQYYRWVPGPCFRRSADGTLTRIPDDPREGQWSGRGAGGCGDIASARPVGGGVR